MALVEINELFEVLSVCSPFWLLFHPERCGMSSASGLCLKLCWNMRPSAEHYVFLQGNIQDYLVSAALFARELQLTNNYVDDRFSNVQMIYELPLS